MNTIGAAIAPAGQLALLYAERLLKGIRNEDFARFARPGGTPVASNHPAFIVGHLGLYPAQVLRLLGRPAGPAAVPEGWEALFKNGVECRDDADGRIYPKMEALTHWFFEGYRAALGALAQADDALLSGPNPVEGRMRELFPTLGALLAFYIAGHTQSHLGQLSAWRRMMGLPAA